MLTPAVWSAGRLLHVRLFAVSGPSAGQSKRVVVVIESGGASFTKKKHAHITTEARKQNGLTNYWGCLFLGAEFLRCFLWSIRISSGILSRDGFPSFCGEVPKVSVRILEINPLAESSIEACEILQSVYHTRI